MDQQNLEDRPIPGITAKGLAWLMGSVIAVIVTVMGATFSIKSDIQNVNNQVAALSTRVETLQKQGDARDAEIKAINEQVRALQIQTALIEDKIKK